MNARAAGDRNWFAIWVSIVAVVLIAAVGVLVVWMNNSQQGPGVPPLATSVNQETGAIQVGNGPDQVSIYADFMCPHCQSFERAAGADLTRLVEEDAITLELFPVALPSLDQASGTQFSTRSANALYCVAEAEPEQTYAFNNAIFAQAPRGEGLSDEQLIQTARDLGVEGIETCVEEVSNADFIQSLTQTIPVNPQTGRAGTPTVLVNGEFVPVTGDPQADILDRLNG